MSVNPGQGTGSLEKAIDLLEAVESSPEGISQVELAARLGLPRTTVYRLLATLIARGMIRRDPLRQVYCLGLRCFEMARQSYAMPDLVGAAALEMRALRDLTGETTYLGARDGLEVISLERVTGVHSHRSEAILGRHKPMHCTSQGKAILAAMEEPAREALIRELTLTAQTPLTITDRRRLHADIRITAARGYSIDDEEIALGVRCVGAAIVDAQGKVRGALSIAGPAYRLTRERLDLLGPEVAEAARRVGAQLTVVKDSGPAAGEPAPIPGRWAFHGAFPIWSKEHDCLFWADTLAPAIHCWNGRSDTTLMALDSPILGMASCDDLLIVAQASNWLAIEADGSTRACQVSVPGTVLALAEGGPGRMWAAVEHEQGYVLVGALGIAGRFEPRWRIDEPVGALCPAPEQGMLYATTPGSGSILMLREDDRTIRRFISMPRGSGRPLGLARDAAGGIWTAMGDGWSVLRFSADGGIDRVQGMPVPHPVDLAVGGHDGQTLFITSARHRVPMETLASAPLSGRLFSLSLAPPA